MKKLLLLFSIILLGLNIYSNEIYVKADASGSANGTDWDNAYTSLTAAINVASSDDIIYVAKGEYKPHANDRGQSFKIEKNIKIYGGFIGNETVTQSIIDNRDFVTNETILSGDLNGDDGDNFTNRSDNSCHVVHIQGESNSGLIANTVLDGFTISGGYADSANVNNDEGAGIYLIGNYNSVCSPILKNLVIKNNYAKKTGGGLNIGSDNGDCNPQILNCSFINNKADHGGAVNTKVIISNCGAIFNNVEFKNNSAVYDGGAVYNSADNEHTNTTNYINVLFDNNSADKGGAIFNYSNATGNFNGGTNKVIVKNATFINNNAASGSAIYNKEQDGTCEPEYTNIIVYNNKLYSSSGNNKINFSNYSTTTKPKISYSLILGSGGSGNWDNAYGIDSGNNLDADPLFVDAENSNCNLRVGSPALLAGNDGSNIGYYKGIAIENSAKTTPIITTWPAASNDISPGDTLSKAGLTTYGKAKNDLAGTFSYVNPNIIIQNKGDYNAEIKFTPTDVTNYNEVINSNKITISVEKINVSITTWPTASNISLGQNVSSSTFTGGIVKDNVAGEFKFIDDTYTPSYIGLFTLIIKFFPADTNRYYSTVSNSTKIRTTASTNIEINNSNNSFNVYPNPVLNTLFIKNIGNNKITSIVIYNALGNKMEVVEIDTFKGEIDISNIKKGIYFIKIAYDNKEEIYKIIKCD